ncbi:MAG: basic secretory protein-like protein, partial [candidate division KSB1 bacterium]|nr:basic secretory protein-like protein [candidate division KSB1 bacterium]
FDIYFYPEEKVAVEQAARMMERWYARLSTFLQHELSGRQPLILYASQPHFQQTNVVGGQIGEGTGGVTEALKRRIVLPLAGPLAETDHVLGHELVHAFQFDITGQGGGSFRAPTALRLPLWFIEGMAEFLSIGAVDPHTAMWMRDAVKSQKKLPTIAQLENPRFFPYRYGQSLLAYIAGRWGDGMVANLLKQAGKSGDIYFAIRQALGVAPDTLARDWHRALRVAYDSLAATMAEAKQYGRLTISKQRGAGDLNVGPVLSPDGSAILFFSEKNLFAINLFLADAATGRTKQKIVRTELDPHYESLGFIKSAGAWDATGERIVFPLVTRGRPALSLRQVKRNKLLREIRFPQLGEIFHPTWSPDGRFIAFSALAEGMVDLFLYDLQADSLRRLTQDLYAELQPAWSPDGKLIAFTTDRFTSDLSLVKSGNYRVALFEVNTGSITAVPGFAQGKHINPQWSPDSKSIYFLCDRTGITNIYRVELATGNLFQLTDLYTGVSGITASSPALSVASKVGHLSFSVYEQGNYNIYTIDSPETLVGKPVAPVLTELVSNPAALPPSSRLSAKLDSLLQDHTIGLSKADSTQVVKYKPKLSLTYIGQPFLAAGYSSYGVYLGAGITLLWSDMLGDHNLATMLQTQFNGDFREFAGFLGYLNATRRWNWGVAIQQIPYITSQFATGTADIDGQPVYVEQELRYRQLSQHLSVYLAYPVNRAQRFELSAALERISFDRKLRTVGISLVTGARIIDRTDDLSAPEALNLANASLALVYDTSIFGATSPIVGQSYRFEFTPITGSLSWHTILADYRRYLMPVRPLTLAMRLLHYGRYGRDAEDARLSPIYIGFPNIIRGYSSDSFDATECIAIGEDPCPVYNQLFGSRIAVANFELRFPLFGVLGLGPGYYGALPVEAGGFYDMGVAWTKADRAWLLGGEREPVKSYGAMARMNLFGYLIFEVDFVQAVDRPRKGWFWQFNFTTGF